MANDGKPSKFDFSPKNQENIKKIAFSSDFFKFLFFQKFSSMTLQLPSKYHTQIIIPLRLSQNNAVDTLTVSNDFLYSALNKQKQTPGRRGYGNTLSFYPYTKTVQNDKRKNECKTYQILHYKKNSYSKKPHLLSHMQRF